ncbi:MULTISPECIES: glycosyltransferase family 1 protein [unclassified Massilia]|uniref:glycosyltransferase family 4 protein n=1 Tax=unclassified Massilia TaxID=2609279 RepID=UPI00177E9B95|nr:MULTISPECIES: glycosyltransferase family 1 protein [unclassified Massilia]MBD8528782.1 glycosyltransferase family 4 protein [Massilia sp. CFBP 13647]MBD8673423.1 glycosyltransferase family 4 protein [Massilia sp. CFBP 13721]
MPDLLFINGKIFSQPITGVQRYAMQILDTVDALLADGSWVANCRLVLLISSSHTQPLPSYRHIEIREISGSHLHYWEQIRLPWATRGAMLLNLAGSAPLLKLGQICTFHDTAVFDMPDAYSPAFVRWYRLLFSVQAKLSRRLLTVSEFSKERICHHLGVSSEKVGVLYGAADHMRTQSPDSGVLSRLGVEPKRYFLAVGSANPTKNFSRLVEAFSGLPDPDARLVVVGGSNAAVFASSGRTVEDDSRIIRAGRLTDAELKSLYSYARAYVFPSIYEGFGLPPIEAMLCGCPVIAARAASIPEICGQAAAYFDPLSVESMRSAMGRALRDDDWLDRLSVLGREHVKKFSWYTSANQLLSELSRLGLATPANINGECQLKFKS